MRGRSKGGLALPCSRYHSQRCRAGPETGSLTIWLFLQHLAHFFLPCLAVAGLSAAAVRLLWRAQTARIGWARLAGWSAVAGSLAYGGTALWQGRDGTMAGYAALVLAVGVTQAILMRPRT